MAPSAHLSSWGPGTGTDPAARCLTGTGPGTDPVVLQVVGLERHGERNADRQVGEDAQQPVGQRSAVTERQVVRQLVDRCREGERGQKGALRSGPRRGYPMKLTVFGL